jgi:hypothetical protein
MSASLAIGAAATLALAAGLQSSMGGSRAPSASPQPGAPPEKPRIMFDEQSTRTRALLEAAALVKEEPDAALPSGVDSILGVLSHISSRRRAQERLEAVFKAHKVDPELISTLLIRSMIDYVANGRQSFVVGPRLQEMFTQTSLPEQVDAWMLQTPYPAFYVALPGCREQIWGTYNSMSIVRGVMVDMEFRRGHMALLLWAPLPVERVLAHHGLDERQLPPEAKKQLRGQGNDSYLIFNIEDAVSDPRGLEVHILDQWERSVAEEGWPQHAIDATAKSRVDILKVVLGTILYLQSERNERTPDPAAAQADAERAELQAKLRNIKTPAKRRKVEDKLKSLPTGGTVTYLGRSIEEAPQAADGSGDPRSLRRHWVRGHWRRPARKHGPRVLVWIQPFVRGSGEAVPARTYRLPEEP